MRILTRISAATLTAALGAATWLAMSSEPSRASASPTLTAGKHVMQLKRHAGANQHSLNWAGYIRAGQDFRNASGTWTVPKLASTYDGYSSTWVGIDGATSEDKFLIQTGTEADVVNGQRSYRAWWEVITPTNVAPETLFSNLTVSPGDSITATVSQLSSGRWKMALIDNTTGRSASHTTAFAGPGSSAEWIQEDTDVDGYISTAPKWSKVKFTNLTLNDDNPKLRASEAVDLVDREGTREARTSAPTSAGDGFSVKWLATGTKTYAG